MRQFSVSAGDKKKKIKRKNKEKNKFSAIFLEAVKRITRVTNTGAE